ncbi:MAG: hypothetical protein RR949_06900, partial [Oscillospiraceae bacterium]
YTFAFRNATGGGATGAELLILSMDSGALDTTDPTLYNELARIKLDSAKKTTAVTLQVPAGDSDGLLLMVSGVGANQFKYTW